MSNVGQHSSKDIETVEQRITLVLHDMSLSSLNTNYFLLLYGNNLLRRSGFYLYLCSFKLIFKILNHKQTHIFTVSDSFLDGINFMWFVAL